MSSIMHQSIHPSILLSPNNLSISPSIHPSVHPFNQSVLLCHPCHVRLSSVQIAIHPSIVHPSSYPPVHPPVCPSVCLSIYSPNYPTIHPLINPSVCLSIHPRIRAYVHSSIYIFSTWWPRCPRSLSFQQNSKIFPGQSSSGV